jgi:dinuclear metal center YbgI/SA1388 family protein
MKVGEILNYMNEFAPFDYAESWDNVGLMLGSRQSEVSKVLLCLDVTSKVIREAIGYGAELIVSHHPFFFSKLSSLDFDTIKGQQLQTLTAKDISVISAHTNLDVAVGGVNDTLAETVGLKELKALRSYVPQGYEHDLGLGKIGILETYTDFNEFIDNIKKSLNITNLRVIGSHPEKVKNVAVFCGSFDVELDYLSSLQQDVLITGDLKYHTALEAREMGLCIIDVGHFASEHVILSRLQKLLADKFDSIEVICSKMESDPFIFA